MEEKKVAKLIVECLENEGVEYIFGVPGEENIDILDELLDSKIRFIVTRHEQGASFMADVYGRLTRRAGVCLATLGPGAINLLLGTADAHLDSSPLVALAAQASLDRLNKESHQVIDLVALFRPVTKWAGMIGVSEVTGEVIRKAFKVAQSERCGATAVIIPEDIVKLKSAMQPITVKQPKRTLPNPDQIQRAVDLLKSAKKPMILAGHGICRTENCDALKAFVEATQIPAAVTFMAKGALSSKHPLCMGTIGFMKHDLTNFGIDNADVIIAIGYDLIEYTPHNWNPKGDKTILHIHNTPAEVDQYYTPEIGIQGDIGASLTALSRALDKKFGPECFDLKIRETLLDELTTNAADANFPLKPQKIVADIRAAMGDDDIVLCDTGALKMWMARLYPCYQPDTCLISNSLATMAFSLPGALAAKLVHPDRKVLAVMGDGSFMMNSQELETAKREKIPFVILIWRDEHYGLIEWKQNLELGRPAFVKFDNPDFVKYADSFGIKGYRIESADQLLPTLKQALNNNELAIIDCPVDYSENIKLTDKLGELTEAL